jgi:2-dehydro-3-deoxyphosphogluconate aldolase / (4S)-4-hydroxy-2-oxoglutarate aldolase
LSFRSAGLSREESVVPLTAASRFLADEAGFGMTRDRLVFAASCTSTETPAATKGDHSVKKEEVLAKINEIGIMPGIRTSSAEDGRFAAEAIAQGGIPIVEITMTVPKAIEVIADMVRNSPNVIVGAGTVLDLETARRCIAAGAGFLTSPGLNLKIVEFAVKENILIIAGAMTPTEVIDAWQAGSELVKVFPCAPIGGPAYIRALKGPFPQVPIIAAGGVNQETAADFILAGAAALGIGGRLIPKAAIEHRQPEQISELARRFLRIVKTARNKTSQRH